MHDNSDFFFFFDGIIWVYYGTGVQKKRLCKKSTEMWGEKLAQEREKEKG